MAKENEKSIPPIKSPKSLRSSSREYRPSSPVDDTPIHIHGHVINRFDIPSLDPNENIKPNSSRDVVSPVSSPRETEIIKPKYQSEKQGKHNHSTSNHSTSNHSTHKQSTSNHSTHKQSTSNHSTHKQSISNHSTSNHSTHKQNISNNSTEKNTTYKIS